mgnify:CR=1 FL=1
MSRDIAKMIRVAPIIRVSTTVVRPATALAEISGALGAAGQHYAETELAAASLFR